MPPQINRDTFEKAELGTKLLLIFDMLGEHGTMLSEHTRNQELMCGVRSKECGERFRKVENRKKVDAGLSAVGGIIGGFVAIIIKAKFWE